MKRKVLKHCKIRFYKKLSRALGLHNVEVDFISKDNRFAFTAAFHCNDSNNNPKRNKYKKSNHLHDRFGCRMKSISKHFQR